MADGCYDENGKCVNCGRYHPCSCEAQNSDDSDPHDRYAEDKAVRSIYEAEQNAEARSCMEDAEREELSFYDTAEQNGTLIYYQCDSDGNDIKGEDY